MRKLIKPKSQRERMRTLALTPSRSECGGVDGFLPPDSQDSSSIGSGSNSLDDTLATGQQHRRSSSTYRGGRGGIVQIIEGHAYGDSFSCSEMSNGVFVLQRCPLAAIFCIFEAFYFFHETKKVSCFE